MERIAEWLKISIYGEGNVDSPGYFCSDCKFVSAYKISTCPNCGCHMSNSESKEE